MTFIDALSKENAKGSFSASAIYGHAALLDLAKFPFESEESIMKKISTAGGARDDSALQHTELSQLKILEEQMRDVSRYLHQQYLICQKF